MIDPRALLTFHAVCEAGTISGAARMLNLSQPSVSNAIAALEARIGARLFDRSRSGIVLTAEGQALSLRARMLNNLLRDAESEVAGVRAGVWGPLQIGGTPGALVSLLPRAIGAFDDLGVKVSLNVVERPDSVLNEMLRSGDIELAFVTTEIGEMPDDLVETTISRDPFTLIVGRSHDDLPDQMSLAATRDLRWVLPEAHGAFRRQVDALFIANGLPMPREVVRCDSLLTTKAIVRSSNRVTILPRAVASAELSIGVLRAIVLEDANFTRSVGIRRHRDHLLSEAARQLLQYVASDV
ncbi:LysR family transcriptional regulator [Novosphingobium olei]|uniref:LysR family transcriptional regulator n=1 Tax=Novosphingobium olei TaxID=2728851 RepID=A0A7Y0BQ42_9SPHN|nr:LysR family transcriptional regulator [Novosphingobium olei]NML94489.1 LysR family transcriptional regulator [Novosphingobium olei]BEV02525.1 LysR family transcriptional regulator [Novosphingobium olei]